MSLFIFASCEMHLSMDSSSFFFFLQTLKTFFHLLSFAFLTSNTVSLTSGQVRGLAFWIPSCKFTLSATGLLCLMTTSPSSPHSPSEGHLGPSTEPRSIKPRAAVGRRVNCTEAHPDRVSQRPKFQKQGTTPRKVNSAPDGC